MSHDIPPMRAPEDIPPVHTQADLEQLWRMLMGPLGFGHRALWLQVLDSDHRTTPVLLQIEDVPRIPTDGGLDRLLEMTSHFLEPGWSVAFLLTGPGRRGLTPEVRAWARGLLAAVQRAGLPVWPVHRANDVELAVCAVDDLAA